MHRSGRVYSIQVVKKIISSVVSARLCACNDSRTDDRVFIEHAVGDVITEICQK
jgi:hypothetical protein